MNIPSFKSILKGLILGLILMFELVFLAFVLTELISIITSLPLLLCIFIILLSFAIMFLIIFYSFVFLLWLFYPDGRKTKKTKIEHLKEMNKLFEDKPDIQDFINLEIQILEDKNKKGE